MRTGEVPPGFNVGIIKPILKDDKAAQDDLKNTRPITISDSLSNIFEPFVLNRIMAAYAPIRLEKEQLVRPHCLNPQVHTAAAKEREASALTLCYRREQGLRKVNREKMLFKLSGKIDENLWMAVKAYYDEATVLVELDGERMERFGTRCGVKQGGPLSPMLFSIYVEQLIEELQSSPGGVTIGGLKISVLVYADDVLLVAEDERTMQTMLQTCDRYGQTWNIKWNPGKTQLIKAGQPKASCQHLRREAASGKRDKVSIKGAQIQSDMKETSRNRQLTNEII